MCFSAWKEAPVMNLTYMLRELALGLEGALGLVLVIDLIDVGISIVETTFV
jgi:hypothetical protein